MAKDGKVKNKKNNKIRKEVKNRKKKLCNKNNTTTLHLFIYNYNFTF